MPAEATEPPRLDADADADADADRFGAVVGSWEWDVGTDLVSVSSTAAALLGLRSRSAALDLDGLLATVGDADRRRVTATIRAALEVSASFTSRFDTAAEPARTIRVVGRALTVRGGIRIAGIIEDVTDAVRTGEVMRRSQRLASLGLLAAGIAHDVNNVLTVVTMRADMIRSDALAGEAGDAAGDAAAILEAATVAGGLTRQLMLFAGGEDGQPTAVDATQLAEKIQPIVQSLRGTSIEVAFELSEVPPVLADPAQLEQVLLNLALNARDALTTAPPIDGAAPRVVIRVQPASLPCCDAAVALEVSDNGPGMDAETRERACDPFFTTKKAGMGNGLGLSVVSGIAERLGGVLAIDSVPGVGTSVRVVLPGLAAQPVGAPRSGVGEPVSAPGVLVVDDDPEVRTAHEWVLHRAGFRVSPAADAAGALARLAVDPPVAAVVYDVQMSGMGGTEFAARALRDHPDVRVLLLTASSPPTDVLVHPRVGLVDNRGNGWQIVAGLRELLRTRV